MKFTYIINCADADEHLRMSLLSSISLRITNPDAKIVWLCDRESNPAIQDTLTRFKTLIDEVIVVGTPDKDNTYKNRWIKTQLPKLSPFDTLYLDSDTLIRKRIDPADFGDVDFAAVANHNGFSLSEQIWEEDQKFLDAMQWQQEFSHYLNGGVWYFHYGTEALRLFGEWHRLWTEGAERTGRLRDQPSLNVALRSTGVRSGFLVREFNEQVQATNCSHFAKSKVWHFYSSSLTNRYGYKSLLARTMGSTPSKIFLEVESFINRAGPWKNQDWISRTFLAHRDTEQLCDFEMCWLSGYRVRSIGLLARRLHSFPSRFFTKLRSR